MIRTSVPAADRIPVRAISFDAIRELPRAAALKLAPINRDDVVEIVYTSGTTGEPKGIVHRHRNIVANLKPFKNEIDKYKKWARPFQPIRILNLLPLRLGFLVIQGYGLTETSPVVAVNHPFHARRGSLGKAIEGQDVRIAPDGEILVRGESVVREVDEQGWFHTGDIGEINPEGLLYYKGRKKDVIVTSRRNECVSGGRRVHSGPSAGNSRKRRC